MLAGQPEFAARLDDPGLRQLKQRVALRCEIAPFELPETAAYVASRIRTAGGDASRLFTREAVMLIHEYSGGIPRTISVICDNALVSAMAPRTPLGGSGDRARSVPRFLPLGSRRRLIEPATAIRFRTTCVEEPVESRPRRFRWFRRAAGPALGECARGRCRMSRIEEALKRALEPPAPVWPAAAAAIRDHRHRSTSSRAKARPRRTRSVEASSSRPGLSSSDRGSPPAPRRIARADDERRGKLVIEAARTALSAEQYRLPGCHVT